MICMIIGMKYMVVVYRRRVEYRTNLDYVINTIDFIRLCRYLSRINDSPWIINLDDFDTKFELVPKTRYTVRGMS